MEIINVTQGWAEHDRNARIHWQLRCSKIRTSHLASLSAICSGLHSRNSAARIARIRSASPTRIVSIACLPCKIIFTSVSLEPSPARCLCGPACGLWGSTESSSASLASQPSSTSDTEYRRAWRDDEFEPDYDPSEASVHLSIYRLWVRKYLQYPYNVRRSKGQENYERTREIHVCGSTLHWSRMQTIQYVHHQEEKSGKRWISEIWTQLRLHLSVLQPTLHAGVQYRRLNEGRGS